jgi:hypothetical protein
MSEDIDQRSGQPYVGKAFNGHGEGCLCPLCIQATMSDLVEAGILDMEGISDKGVMLLRFKSEDETGVDWRSVFKRYAIIVLEQTGQGYLHPSDWSEDEWEAIVNAEEDQ